MTVRLAPAKPDASAQHGGENPDSPPPTPPIGVTSPLFAEKLRPELIAVPFPGRPDRPGDSFSTGHVSLPPVGGCLLGPAVALNRSPAGHIDLSSLGISPVETIRALIPRLESGEIRIRIPLKPGEYPVGWGGSFFDASYVVSEGFAEVTVRFTSGRLTEFRTDFHPPFDIKIHRIGIPIFGLPLTSLLDADVEGTYLVTGGDCPSRRGKIYAAIDNTGPNFLIPDPDLTSVYLKFLGIDQQRRRFPETISEVMEALLNRPPTTPDEEANFLPLDFDQASIASASVIVRPGPITVGPVTVLVGGGPDGRGTAYSLQNSNRSEVHTGPIAFEGITLRDPQGDTIANIRDFRQEGLNLLLGETVVVSGGSGSMGEVRANREGGTFTGGRISWDRFSTRLNPNTGEARIHVQGFGGGRLQGQGNLPFSIQNFRGNLFLHRTISGDADIVDLAIGEASLRLRSALLRHEAMELELGESEILQASFGAQIRLDRGTSFNPLDPNQIFFGFGFSSPEFRIRGGNMNIESFSRREGDRVILLPSSLKNVRIDFDGDEFLLRGESAVNLSQMRFQFGRGLGFPLETDLTFAHTRVTGPMERFRITNIMGQRPGGIRMRMDGRLRLSGDGSGVIESSDPINQFRFRTEQLGYSAEVRHVRLEEGVMQELQMGEARLDLQHLSGSVSAFRTLETNLEPDSGATVSIAGFEADLRTFRRAQQERATSPIRVARFTGFTIDLSAHSHQNILHLAPERHNHGQDLHLMQRSVQTTVDQSDNIADIVYDPTTGRTRLLFRGGRLLVQSVSQ